MACEKQQDPKKSPINASFLIAFIFPFHCACFHTETEYLKSRGANHRTLIEAPLEAHRSNATAAPDGRELLTRLRLNKNLADFDQPVVNTTQIVCDCFLHLNCRTAYRRHNTDVYTYQYGGESQIFQKK